MRNKLGIKLKDLSFPTKVSSILERKITDFLLQNNINFIDQYRFDYFKKYPFDFYFPEFNLVLEPGGDQHFILINKWGDEDKLKKIKERDKRKYDYCIQNGITILYYFEFSRKNIYFISEDDGNWFINEKDKYNIGFQSSFSIGWADSFVKALENLSKYVEENGVPVRYQLGTDKDGNQIYGDICNYRLE